MTDDKKLIERLRSQHDRLNAMVFEDGRTFKNDAAKKAEIEEAMSLCWKFAARLEALTATQGEVETVDGDVAKDFFTKLAFCPSTDRGIDYEARDWRNRTRLTLYGEWAEFCMWVIDHQGRILSALEPQEAVPATVASIVPEHCSGSALAFSEGVLHVSKDGSGYIAIREEHFELEDDRCEGPDGPEGSVHWITRFPPGEMQALRDFLNGGKFHPTPDRGELVEAVTDLIRRAKRIGHKSFRSMSEFEDFVADVEAAEAALTKHGGDRG